MSFDAEELDFSLICSFQIIAWFPYPILVVPRRLDGHGLVLVDQGIVLKIIELKALVRWSAVLLSYEEEPVRDSHELEFGVADVADLGGGHDVHIVACREVRVQSGALHGEVVVHEDTQVSAGYDHKVKSVLLTRRSS